MVDHGYVNPNPVVDDADGDNTGGSESGAAALFSATAALIATFLMF